jgi:hypothetical protein
MKKLKATFLLVMILLLSSSIIFAQQAVKKNKKAPPKRITVDTRVDNMAYWKNMARLGLVPVTPEMRVEPATYTGSKIKAKSVLFDDSPDVPLTTVNSTQSENSVFVDPNDKNHALNSNNSTQNPVGSLYGANDFFTFDGGENWGGEVQGAGGSNSGDPTTAISNTGRMYVGYISNNSGQGISYSTNGGQTWTAKQVAPNPGSMLDKNHLWIDNSTSSPYDGRLYDAWTAFGGSNNNQIEVSHSSDGGLTWSTGINVSAAVNAGSHNQGVNLHTGPNGEVYAIWAIYDSWPSDETAIGFAKSMDGGVTFSPAHRIVTNLRGIRTSGTSKNMRVNSFPSMTVDISNGPNRGNLYIVWSNIGTPGVNTGNDIDVYMFKSTDNGTTWSASTKINQDPSGLGKEHYFPWICCDASSGTLSCIFYDDRNVSSTKCEVYAANSRDGGQTWEDFKISDVSFTPTPIPGLASSYMGDYLGISSQNRKVYPVWTDNRSGVCMAYTSPFETGPPPNQPWVTYQEHSISDAILGNGDGKLETGETVGLNLTMVNIGDQPTTNVSVRISTESPYINMIDSLEVYGNFNVNDTITIENAFSFSATNDIPNGMDILFNVTATNGDSTWISNFSVKAYAPVLAVGGMSISDASGNSNGGLDPGETADITIATTNIGGYLAQNTIGTLLCSNPLITINNATHSLDTLAIGETDYAVFNVTVSPTAPMDSLIVLNYIANSGAYSAQKSFNAIIGLIFDGFETGNFNQFSWVQGGNQPWTISNINPIEGTYCARTGVIGNNLSSQLSLSYNVGRNDSISFFRKVSSQPTYDFLGFYIDNVQKGQWSGEKAWERVSIPVTAGVHTFKWAYYKNNSVSSGSDAGWIDYIIFPPSVATTHAITGKVTYPNTANSPLSNLTLTLKNNSGSVVGTTTTNATGDYTFPTLPDGVYTIEPTTILPWTSVTATDVLLFRKHIANITPLTGIYLASGDVNGSGSLTASDVLLIRKRIASVISSFSVGDWLFNTAPINLIGNDITNNFNGILYGDANASFTTKGEKSVIANPSSSVVSIETVNPATSDVTVPVHASDVQNLGSFQFTIQYDPSKLAFSNATDWYQGIDDVTMGAPKAGQLTFVWAAETNGIDIAEGILTNLHFKSIANDVSGVSFVNTPTPVEFSDFNGTVFTPSLKDGLIDATTGISVTESSDISIYPNPGKGVFKVTYNQPVNEPIKVKVVNALGKTVFEENNITNAVFNINLSQLSQGAYYLKIENNNKQFIKKLIIQ